MRFVGQLVKCAFLLLVSLAAHSANVSVGLTPELQAKITKMIKSNLPDASVGVVVQDIRTGKILYDYHGAKHFLPASTTKLFTAAAALKKLGANYKYETSLYYNLQGLKQGVHHGDVAIKFTGDPSFKVSYLYSLLKRLQQVNVHEIVGDIIIDDTIFDGPMLGYGWTQDSTSWYHAAPVSAIIIDRNQFGVTLYPATEIGGTVNVKFDANYPASKYRTLSAGISGVTFEDSETICQLVAEVDEQNNVALSGCWPIGTQPAYLRLAVKNPRLQAQRLIMDGLDKLNIVLRGKIRFAPIPDNLNKLAHHESEPLHVMLNAMLGDSNNMYAESLIKTLGAELFERGSFKTGSFAMQKILAELTGIDFSQTRLFDGSGESRYNLLTPLHLSRLLYVMHHDRQLGNHFRHALSLSGVSGTLQHRFASFDTKASIKAKTGSLKGASALSGYLTTRSKHDLIVTIMINHSVENRAMLKQFENELCYFLVNQL